MDRPYLREQTRKEKINNLSSLPSRRLVSFLFLLLILLALAVATFLVGQAPKLRLYAANDSGRVEAESASLSGPVTTGYDANASGPSTTANYIQFGTATGPTPTPTSSPTATSPAANCSTTNLVWVSPTGSDSNPGTQAAPWKTFYHTAQSIKQGQTAIFMDGTYNETQEVRVFVQGTAMSPVCFESQHPWGATLSYSLPTGAETSIMLYAPYQYFLNFQVYIASADPAIYVYGIQTWYPCKYCIIQGNKITFSSSIAAPFGIKPNGDFTIIDHNSIENTVDSVDSQGIVISNNDIHLVHPQSGIGRVWGVLQKGGTRNSQVYNNYIHTNLTGIATGGIDLGGASCSTCMYQSSGYENYNSVAWNNIVAPDNSSITSLDRGLTLEACSNCTFNNNVVVGSSIGLRTYAEVQPTYNPTFINNIVVNATDGFSAPSGSYTGTLTIDYNLFYNVTNLYPQAHGITGQDPLFYNLYSDWHLQSSSPAIGAAETAGPFATYSDSPSGTTCSGDPEAYPCTPPTPAISIVSDNPCSLVSGTWTCSGSGYQQIPPWDMGAYNHRDGAATITPSPTATCTTALPSGTGMATTSITIPSTGSYMLWTRMMAPSSSAHSYYLQVDSGCPYLVSDTIGTNSWDWVNSAPISLALATGSHTITMVGNQTGVKVDELLFSQSCTPTGTGDSCFSTMTPTPAQSPTPTPPPQATYPSGITNVFVIVMENQDWSQIKGNTTSAPYINSLLTRSDASYASNYHNVMPSETSTGYLHPSEPNYIWLEAGTNSFADHTFTNDNDATSGNYTTSTNHLTTLLQNKGISWKAYEESMPSGCPITSSGNYAAKHNPFVFFTDVSGNPPSSTSTNCSSHVVPFTQLATDVQNNSLPSYSFITPNLCDDMHDNSCAGSNDPIHQGDTWLSNNLPTILNAQAYKNGGAVFITWDEDAGSTTNNPIGMMVLSPLAKGNGYTNTTLYSHSSFVRTVETIFGLSPLLANASSAPDLADLFVTSDGLPPTPTPSPSPTSTNTPPPALWAQDTFQRSDQSYWGTASNGMTWEGDANSSSSFSISNDMGLIEPSSAANLNAVLGLSVANAEVFMSGSMTALAGGANSLGVMLRWSNPSNYYRAVITGSKLVIQRVVNGSVTGLKSTSFPASPHTSYIIRFQANGTTLSAKAWQTDTVEPADWMVTATDSTFSSGQCGIRTRQQSGTIATITSFQATQL